MVKRDLYRHIGFILLVILALFVVNRWFLTVYRVTSQDENSFIKENQLVLVAKKSQPTYQQFVLYRVEGKDYVGRVIAKAGDAVTYMDDVFYLNHEVKEEPYLIEMRQESQAVISGEYFTHDFDLASITTGELSEVPDESFLILNDNRLNTKDSREFGLIKSSQIKGVLTFRISPLSQFGFIKTTNK